MCAWRKGRKEMPPRKKVSSGSMKEHTPHVARPAGVRMCARRKGLEEMPPRKKVSSGSMKEHTPHVV